MARGPMSGPDVFNCGHGRTNDNTARVGPRDKKQSICRLCQRVRQQNLNARRPKSTRLTLGQKIALGIIR